MIRATCSAAVALTLALSFALAACGCTSSRRATDAWMKSVNSIKPGAKMDSVRKALGRPDTKKTGETPLRPYPPIGSPEGVLGTLPAETKYEQWIYKRGDSRYHVFFARRSVEPHTWECIAVRSAPEGVVN